MPPMDVKLRGMVFAMAVVLGPYIALLFVTSASLFSDYYESIVGVMLVGASAAFLRRQLGSANPTTALCLFSGSAERDPCPPASWARSCSWESRSSSIAIWMAIPRNSGCPRS